MSAQQEEEQYLRGLLLVVTNWLLVFLNWGEAGRILSPRPRIPFGGQHPVYFELLELESNPLYPFLVVDHYPVRPTGKIYTENVAINSEDSAKATVTWNRCRDSIYLLLDYLRWLLVENVTEITWMRALPRPRFIFIDRRDLGREHPVSHDFAIIRFSSGNSFVFDPTGYQFGFPDFLYTEEDYRRRFLEERPRLLNEAEEKQKYEDGANSGDRMDDLLRLGRRSIANHFNF